MDESNGGSRTVKVVDRRKFTADGDLREQKRPEKPAAAPPAQEDSPGPDESVPRREAPAGEPSGGAAGATSSHFLGLVAMLVQHAELLLVGAEDLTPRPEEARTVIDFLGALEEKTAGNLSREEEQALSSVLYQLRALYVQKKG